MTTRTTAHVTPAANLQIRHTDGERLCSVVVEVGDADRCEMLLQLRAAEFAHEPGPVTEARWYRLASRLADRRGRVNLVEFLGALDQIHNFVDDGPTEQQFASCGHNLSMRCGCAHAH